MAAKHRDPLQAATLLAAGFILFLTLMPLAAQEENIFEGLEMDLEPLSPEELLPGTAEPGLRRRAVPELPPAKPAAQPLAIYRLQWMQNIQNVQLPRLPGPRDLSTFRPVTTNLPPIGLHPRGFRPGLIEIYPWFGLAQSFDSNVNLTATNPIADFYVTPRAGLEWQIGTPDTVTNEYYDSIPALHGEYEAWADLYLGHPELSAFNQSLEVDGRIGRSVAIWRPSFSYSDQTGSNLLMAELVNRTKRIRIQGAVVGEYQFTQLLGGNQVFSYFSLDHPNPSYINYNVWQTRQEMSYRFLPEMRGTLWAIYRQTDPSEGFSGTEYIVGLGFSGKPDPRIYTELRLGWDVLDMQGDVPGRRNLSGIRFNGWSTFDWGPRFRLTLRYDRDYVFNEVDENDNYVSTLLQTRGEFYLGGSWYLTPYLGFSLQEFETSQRLTLQWRPELEMAYALPGPLYPGDSRIFAKVAYMTSYTIKGDGAPIENWRFSVGMNWKF